jgi:putative oxidoreductase
MGVVHRVGRELLAPMFVSGGLDAIRHPEAKVTRASTITAPIAATLGIPDDPVALVRFNGGVQVVAGTLLGMGRFSRLAALTLAASLIPTTLAGHRFWAESDPKNRAAQQIQLLKNAAMLGGLFLVVADGG